MKRKTKNKHRGLAPAASKLREMHALGYGTPAEAAIAGGVSTSAVYTWAKTGKLEKVDERPAWVKVGANLWVLIDAVKRRTAIPAAVSG